MQREEAELPATLTADSDHPRCLSMPATRTFQLKRADDLYNDCPTPPDLFASWIRSLERHPLQRARSSV